METPNDPKLSHGGGWRGLCRWVERWRRSAAQAVTAVAVGCSAWLGVCRLKLEVFIADGLPPAKEGEDAVIKSVAIADGKQSADERAAADGDPKWAGSAEEVSCEREKENDAAEQEATSEPNALLQSVWLVPVVHNVECTARLELLVVQNRSLKKTGARTPNDPKLSHGGAWRGSCGVRRRRDIRVRKECGTHETGTSVKSQLP